MDILSLRQRLLQDLLHLFVVKLIHEEEYNKRLIQAKMRSIGWKIYN